MFFKLPSKFRENFSAKIIWTQINFNFKQLQSLSWVIGPAPSRCHCQSYYYLDRLSPDAEFFFRNFWLSDLVFENLKIFSGSKNIFWLLKIKIPKFKNLKLGWTFEKRNFSRISRVHLHQNSWKSSKNVHFILF